MVILLSSVEVCNPLWINNCKECSDGCVSTAIGGLSHE